MKKRRVLFIMNTMMTGGAEKSLANLLSEFDFVNYQVTLALIQNKGPLLKSLNKEIEIIDIFKNKPKPFLRRLLTYFYRKTGNLFFERIYIRKKIPGTYDAIISYMEGLPLKYHYHIVDRAPKNLTWVHTDLELHGCNPKDFSFSHQVSAYKAMSEIIFVSDTIRKKFANIYNFQRSYHVLYNIVDAKKYAPPLPSPPNKIPKIISVGRIVEVKAFDRIIRVASLLKSNGYQAEFQIVGDGPLKTELSQLAKELNVHDYVKFLGEVESPYKLMEASDIVLITSKIEGFSMVAIEAFALGKPVISTNFPAAYEVLNNGQFGMISKEDDESIYASVKYFLDAPDLLISFANRSAEGYAHFSQKSTREQLYNLICG